MIDRARFDVIKRKHGSYASWAIWAPQSAGPKSNVGDLSIFDEARNPNLLKTLQPSVIMVGLNISRPFREAFQNFHDSKAMAQDYKIRHAFEATDYYGAYMTDVIKDEPCVDSRELLQRLRRQPTLVAENISRFRQELRDLSLTPPTILAFGRDAHALLSRNLEASEYRLLVSLTHYSHRISKEDYRATVLGQIAEETSGRPIQPSSK